MWMVPPALFAAFVTFFFFSFLFEFDALACAGEASLLFFVPGELTGLSAKLLAAFSPWQFLPARLH